MWINSEAFLINVPVLLCLSSLANTFHFSFINTNKWTLWEKCHVHRCVDSHTYCSRWTHTARHTSLTDTLQVQILAGLGTLYPSIPCTLTLKLLQRRRTRDRAPPYRWNTLKEFIIWTCLSHYSVRLCLWCVQVQLCSIRSAQRYDREEEYLLKKNVDQRRGQTE